MDPSRVTWIKDPDSLDNRDIRSDWPVASHSTLIIKDSPCVIP
jgi:hypothetical protein